MLVFCYAGPVIASIAFNGLAAIVAAICVYIYLNRKTLKRNRFLSKLSSPLHGTIKKIAKKSLRSKNQNT